MIPSVKTIEARLNIPRDVAKRIRGIMEGHTGKFADKALAAIAETMTAAGVMTHGVETIFGSDEWADTPSIEYVNRGDTYDPTVLYLNGVTEFGRPTHDGRWAVGAWGDIVERGHYR